VIDRRRFIAGSLATVASGASPLFAQRSNKRWRIGFLGANTPAAAGHLTAAFLGRLRELGWTEGRDFDVEYRWAAGQTDRYRQAAGELVAAHADVIVTSGTAPTLAAHAVTNSIPIVMASSGDLPGTGLIESLAHPGGNVTGLTFVAGDSAGKRVELLTEVVSKLRGLAVLANPDANRSEVATTRSAAIALGLTAHVFDFKKPADLAQLAASPVRSQISAIYLSSDPLVFTNRVAIARFAVEQKLPMMARLKEYATDGALMSYGPLFTEFFRRAAEYVDKIWQGAKPGDLPIEQPAKYELVINLKTAREIGVAIPQSVLLRADEVIQ
jgi:putative ABC transport system substrate-binding protein